MVETVAAFLSAALLCAAVLGDKTLNTDSLQRVLKCYGAIKAHLLLFHSRNLDVAGCGVYREMSNINNSCDPNCFAWTLDSGCRELRLIRRVAENEELTIAYEQLLDSRTSTADRRKRLSTNFHFRCACEYCRSSPPQPFIVTRSHLDDRNSSVVTSISLRQSLTVSANARCLAERPQQSAKRYVHRDCLNFVVCPHCHKWESNTRAASALNDEKIVINSKMLSLIGDLKAGRHSTSAKKALNNILTAIIPPALRCDDLSVMFKKLESLNDELLVLSPNGNLDLPKLLQDFGHTVQIQQIDLDGVVDLVSESDGSRLSSEVSGSEDSDLNSSLRYIPPSSSTSRPSSYFGAYCHGCGFAGITALDNLMQSLGLPVVSKGSPKSFGVWVTTLMERKREVNAFYNSTTIGDGVQPFKELQRNGNLAIRTFGLLSEEFMRGAVSCRNEDADLIVPLRLTYFALMAMRKGMDDAFIVALCTPPSKQTTELFESLTQTTLKRFGTKAEATQRMLMAWRFNKDYATSPTDDVLFGLHGLMKIVAQQNTMWRRLSE